VLPSHLALLKPYDPNHRPGPILRFQRVFSRGLERFVDSVYRPALDWALESRYVVMCGFIAVLVDVTGAVASGWIKFQFFPEVEADAITAKLTLPKGVPFEDTVRGVARIEAAAFKLNDHFKDRDGNPIVRHLLASSGTQPFQVGFGAVGGVPTATNLGEVTIELQPSANRDVSGLEIVSKWRELTGEIPGAVELSFRTEAAGGGNAIDLEVSGPNLGELEAATAEVKAVLAEYDGVIDIADSNLEGKRELKLRILPGAEALGLRLEDVARQVRQGFYGDEIQRLQRGRNEVKVFVRYPRDERRSLADLANMKIRTPAGAEVPFGDVAVAEYGRSYATIERSDRQRTIKITADVDKAKGTNANEVVAALTRKGTPELTTGQQWRANLAAEMGLDWRPAEAAKSVEPGPLAKIQERFPSVQYSFEGEQKDQRESVGQMGVKFLVALLLMYVMLAIPLKSYVQPIIVMSVIPFGLVGAVAGHVLMGWLLDPSLANLSIMSMCGIVALAGVVVNDSLVLVDYVNRHRDDGHGLIHAARAAGVRRFRPILLTSLTTFAGLTPMLLETDIQALFLVPMAISLSFGILFATVITLFLVPCVYLMLEDIRSLVSGRGMLKAAPAPAPDPEEKPVAPALT
jgi:multidrug efflux pump subunit AcrB